ncbi:matrixin family metalloprotease [Acinetobacter sp. CWB-B33]|uniref:matrixin family metalloprotease n=1 Tax=Acinetobacter sp. CWB-B33 TaxID=2815724 RepID=UPI0031FF12BF
MRIVIIAFITLTLLFFHFQTRNNFQLRYNAWSDRIMHPLDTRLRYQIAEVDPRFGMSKEQAIQLSKEAIQIWHDGTQKQLFVYDDQAQLKIKLIYDARQENYNAFKKTQQELDQEHSSNQRISGNLDVSKSSLEQMQQSLRQEQIQLRAEADYLNQQRMSWSRIENEQGENRQRIEAQYQALKEKAQQLQRNIAYYNQMNAQYNQQVGQHNSSIERYNWNVMQAKNRFPPREFHKGVFMGDQIQIYQFDTEDDLRLTLAHELGHALGLGHHADPEALMYPVLGEQDLQHFKLKPADQSLLYARR